MVEAGLFLRFGIALAIGFLIGLQREYDLGERKEKLFAGVRTFPLLALAGCTAGLLSDTLGSPWLLVGVVAVLGGLVMIAYHANTRLGRMGLTTETAAISTILIGAISYWEYYALAAALAVITTVVLSLKVEIHAFVRHLSREDLYATLKLAAISAIILPVLPNESYGPAPIDVLNPYRIWLMVVFISAISFVGYVAIKSVGVRRGLFVSGILGGLVSSTAVTLSLAHRSRDREELSRPLALAILVSWSAMFARVLVVAAVLNWALVGHLWLPMLIAASTGALYSLYLYARRPSAEGAEVEFANPFELGPAIQFGALYAVILVAARVAQFYLGDAGVYISSIAAGLADLNAITLSLAELSGASADIRLAVAARALMLASVTNTAVKGGIVLAVGSRGLFRNLWQALVAMSVAGLAAAFLLT